MKNDDTDSKNDPDQSKKLGFEAKVPITSKLSVDRIPEIIDEADNWIDKSDGTFRESDNNWTSEMKLEQQHLFDT